MKKLLGAALTLSLATLLSAAPQTANPAPEQAGKKTGKTHRGGRHSGKHKTPQTPTKPLN